MDVGVAYRPGDDSPAVAPFRTINPPTSVDILFEEELVGGVMHYVMARCRNGAMVSSHCAVPPKFMVDKSPPDCYPYLSKLLGEGAMAWAQAEPTRLAMNFNAAFRDEQSTLRR